jgi:ABC-type antimicrobial peptide transport system permease subunit
VIGAIAGYATGLAGGALWSGLSPGDGARLFDPALLVTVLFAAPILSVLATWIPAYASAQRDPALALRKEA